MLSWSYNSLTRVNTLKQPYTSTNTKLNRERKVDSIEDCNTSLNLLYHLQERSFLVLKDPLITLLPHIPPAEEHNTSIATLLFFGPRPGDSQQPL
jgi:hypothetical protein